MVKKVQVTTTCFLHFARGAELLVWEVPWGGDNGLCVLPPPGFITSPCGTWARGNRTTMATLLLLAELGCPVATRLFLHLWWRLAELPACWAISSGGCDSSHLPYDRPSPDRPVDACSAPTYSFVQA